MAEKIRLSIPVIVEGKYDKNTLSQILDATILTTGGFSVFNAKEQQALLRRICAERGAILLTDSDGGGRQIRGFLLGILPREKVIQLYIPRIPGKESRKRRPSRAGVLGVEGMEPEVLRRLFLPFAEAEGVPSRDGRQVTKTDFFADGLTGAPNAAARRGALCRALMLPDDMTANGLLEAINLLYDYEGYKRAVADLV